MAYPNIELLASPVFRIYLGCSSALVLKMMFMSVYTGFTRMRTLTFANPEDCALLKGDLKGRVKVDERVERIRRAHLNDLESIPIFFVSAFIYTLTDPSECQAKALFFAYLAARIAHTFVYSVVVLPQPARGLSWTIGYCITGYMAVRGLLHFMS